MRAPDRYEFTVQAKHHLEAMLAASKAMMKGGNMVVSIAMNAALTVLSGLGGMAAVTALAAWMDLNPSWWVIVGWFAGGALYLGSNNVLYRGFAERLARMKLNQQPQVMTFDEQGLTFEAGPAKWVTPWAIIDSVVETKQTVTVIVAGISFALPKTAVGDAAAVSSLIAGINAQISNA